MEIKNFKELRKYIEKSINDSLENEVFEAVKKIELEHTETDVLEVYSPDYYVRREDSGINDPENIIPSFVKNGVLEIENVTKFNPGYETENHGLGLVKLIEYGHKTSGYFYDYPLKDEDTGNPYPFVLPRPFIANTRSEINQTKIHIKAMQAGLIRNKIEVK